MTSRTNRQPTTMPAAMTSNACRALVVSVMSMVGTAWATEDAFDWRLLAGDWAESTEHQYGCRPDNLHQRLETSADRKTMMFKNDRVWDIGTSQKVEQYKAEILHAMPNVLVIRYGNDLQGIPDEFRTWELRFIGPGTYRWRAASWPQGVYNDVIGVKCSP